MKIPVRRQLKLLPIYVLILAAFSSCVSRPDLIEAAAVTIDTTVITPPDETTIYIPPEIEVPVQIIPSLSPIEQVIEYVKENGTEIEKYFIFDQNRRIVVKADLRLGDSHFEVTYNLVDAAELGNSEYEVTFTVLEKDTNEVQESALIWKPVAGNAGILLSLDDDYFETWERYMDFFDEHGVKITFFIQGSYVPFSTMAMERGHDVGFHTLSHLDLRQLSRPDFLLEAVESAQSFRQAGVPLSSLAFPYGFSEAWMYDILLEHYSVLRGYGTTFRLYRMEEIGSAYIASMAIDNTVLQGEDNFYRTINTILRTVKFMDKNWVLPLTSHDISNASWAIRHNRLERLLQAAAELKLKFYKYSDFN